MSISILLLKVVFTNATHGQPYYIHSTVGNRARAELGSISRHRFDFMFREAGLDAPKRVIETISPMVVTRVLEETDFVALLPVEVAQYYISCGLIAKLNVTLSCGMDSYGMITRAGWLLSPAAKVMHEALLDAASPGREERSWVPKVVRSHGANVVRIAARPD